MPTTVAELFAAAGVPQLGTVPWSSTIPTSESGVYVVSLCPDPNIIGNTVALPDIDEAAIREWLERVPDLELDGRRSPGVHSVADRLKSFWIPDENVIYIGKATRLKTRLQQYYRTPIGEPAPHSGGHWIKTLSNLQQAFVHFGAAEDFGIREDAMLAAFIRGVSGDSRSLVADPALPLPFANLEYPQGTRKRHGMRNQRSHRATRVQS
jgi:hypothetical protein